MKSCDKEWESPRWTFGGTIVLAHISPLCQFDLPRADKDERVKPKQTGGKDKEKENQLSRTLLLLTFTFLTLTCLQYVRHVLFSFWNWRQVRIADYNFLDVPLGGIVWLVQGKRDFYTTCVRGKSTPGITHPIMCYA